MNEHTLASGVVVNLRNLRPYELDIVTQENPDLVDPGPFRVVVMSATGIMSEWEYNYDELPELPETPEVESKEGTIEEARWIAYRRYQEAITWYKDRLTVLDDLARATTKYILTNCVDPDHQDELSYDDVEEIQALVMVPELLEGEIEAVLASTFPGYGKWQTDSTIHSILEGGEKPFFGFDDSDVDSGDPASVAVDG